MQDYRCNYSNIQTDALYIGLSARDLIEPLSKTLLAVHIHYESISLKKNNFHMFLNIARGFICNIWHEHADFVLLLTREFGEKFKITSNRLSIYNA